MNDGGIRVGLVVEGLTGFDAARALSGTILFSMNGRGLRGECGQRAAEALLFALEDVVIVVQVKDCGHKVLRTCVLIESSNEVTHGGVKFFGVHDRGVENQIPHRLPNGIGLIGRHPDQHFKVNPARHASALR